MLHKVIQTVFLLLDNKLPDDHPLMKLHLKSTRESYFPDDPAEETTRFSMGVKLTIMAYDLILNYERNRWVILRDKKEELEELGLEPEHVDESKEYIRMADTKQISATLKTLQGDLKDDDPVIILTLLGAIHDHGFELNFGYSGTLKDLRKKMIDYQSNHLIAVEKYLYLNALRKSADTSQSQIDVLENPLFRDDDRVVKDIVESSKELLSENPKPSNVSLRAHLLMLLKQKLENLKKGVPGVVKTEAYLNTDTAKEPHTTNEKEETEKGPGSRTWNKIRTPLIIGALGVTIALLYQVSKHYLRNKHY